MAIKQFLASDFEDAREKLAEKWGSVNGFVEYHETKPKGAFARYRVPDDKEVLELGKKLEEFAKATGLAILACAGFYGYEVVKVENCVREIARLLGKRRVWFVEVETDDEYGGELESFDTSEEAHAFARKAVLREDVTGANVREGVLYGEDSLYEGMYSACRTIMRGIPAVIPAHSREVYTFLLVDGKEE